MRKVAVLFAMVLVGCVSPEEVDTPREVRIERIRRNGGGWWKERLDLSVSRREEIIRDAFRIFNEHEAIQLRRTGSLSLVVPSDCRSFLMSPRLEKFNSDGSYVLTFNCFAGDEDSAFIYLKGVIDASLLGTSSPSGGGP